jgi:hypothetical protein
VKETTNKYLIIALLFGIMFHGSSIFFTLENTYDALIHMFFGNHYANSWFEPWNYSWYTGFTVMGYPPLVHQAIGLLSYIGGLKFGMFTVAIIGIILFITGVFRYTVLITGNRTVAGYAAIVAILSSSFVETLHIFGQLPSIIGISVLMHAMPEIYLYIKTGRWKYFFTSLSLIAVTVCSHHVTPLFGMVFFISPLIGMVIMDASREQVNSYKEVKFKLFFNTFISLFKRIVLFCGSAVFFIVFCILPYWINSKANPITQVPIPHGSRDNFLEVTSSGLMFFLIPWGILLFILPYIFYRYYSKRYIFFGLSITLLTILGTGGTTPIPLKILGETAFNILTLDRFTLWASIMSLPIFGEFVYRLVEGDLKIALQNKFGTVYHRILGGLFAGSFLLFTIFTITLGYFRPLQPDKINFLPIVNFLNQDQHDQWRFLPLGFGDQMAFLSTQTNAMTVDGNYHSARRLPELTSRAVERLENSKFRGVEGIGSLQQFLTVPEKYNLKYVFSNDKFYDPILYFCGWHRLTQLENGIMVWEKLNVQPLSKILPKDEVSIVLKLMWGIIPMLTILIAFILNIQMIWLQALKIKVLEKPAFLNHGVVYNGFKSGMIKVLHIWTAIILILFGIGIYFTYIKNATQISPENVVKSYYDALDFKFYEKAHSYVVPDKEYGLAQFMLEISVSDGILNSYGKLDAIEITIKNKAENKATVIAKTKWITPLEIIEKNYTHEVEQIEGKWYIIPDKKDTDLPPDEFIATNINSYYKQGRRKISTQQTYHDDILRQPDLEIIKANLIYFDNKYMVIGEVQNIDNVPADVVLKASLYDDKDKMLGTFNAKYVIKHKLMPKETTSFRVNFEDIAWLNATDVKPTSFNPDEFTDKNFNNKPVTFDIQSAGNVAISDLYTSVAISDLVVSDKEIKGTLFNYGIQEVTVPEVLFSYYNAKKELIYVDHKFIKEGVRIQRKQYFTYSFLNLSSLKSLKYSTANCFVNGISNEAIARDVIKKRKTNEEEEQLQKVNGKGFSYIKIELNNYIGNPK